MLPADHHKRVRTTRLLERLSWGEQAAIEGDPALLRGEGRLETGLCGHAARVEEVVRHQDEPVHRQVFGRSRETAWARWAQA